MILLASDQRAETRRWWARSRAGIQGFTEFVQGLPNLLSGPMDLVVQAERQNSEFHLRASSLLLALSCLAGTKDPLEISFQLLILPRTSVWPSFHSKDSQYSGRTSCLRNSKSNGEVTICFLLMSYGRGGPAWDTISYSDVSPYLCCRNAIPAD